MLSGAGVVRDGEGAAGKVADVYFELVWELAPVFHCTVLDVRLADTVGTDGLA